MFIRAKPVHDWAANRAWSVEHSYCQACGISYQMALYCRYPGLSTHHMAKPGRSDEGCNLLRLCQRCHDLAEGLSIRVDGAVLPTLPLEVCLAIKVSREPAEWNPARILQLMHRASLCVKPVPAIIEAEYCSRRRGPPVLTGDLLAAPGVKVEYLATVRVWMLSAR